MANTVQLTKNGQPVFPVTDVSLVMGLQDAIKLPPVKVATLPTASADTAGKMYYVGPDENDEYERYITSAVNGSYEWIDLGNTAIPLPSIADNLTTNDPTKALSAAQGKVLDGKISQLGQQVIYDVTLNNPTAGPNNDGKFESLSELLSDANLSTLIPSAVRCGGMSVRFVQISDNKYVQYRLTADEWSVDTEDWAIANEGVYVENHEFIYVNTDKDDKILWAIKIDGGIYYGAGVPQQVKDYIEEKISSLSLDEYEDIVAFLSDYLGSDTTLKVMIDGINASLEDKLDAEGLDPDALGTVQAVENPEYIEVTTDSEDKVLEGITSEGVKKINLPIDTQSVAIKHIYNQEYMSVVTDNDDKILSCRKKDGVLKENVGIESASIKTNELNKYNTLKDAINENIVGLIQVGENVVAGLSKLIQPYNVNDIMEKYKVITPSPIFPYIKKASIHRLYDDADTPNMLYMCSQSDKHIFYSICPTDTKRAFGAVDPDYYNKYEANYFYYADKENPSNIHKVVLPLTVDGVSMNKRIKFVFEMSNGDCLLEIENGEPISQGSSTAHNNLFVLKNVFSGNSLTEQDCIYTLTFDYYLEKISSFDNIVEYKAGSIVLAPYGGGKTAKVYITHDYGASWDLIFCADPDNTHYIKPKAQHYGEGNAYGIYPTSELLNSEGQINWDATVNGNIHIHGIAYDRWYDRIWIVTGDGGAYQEHNVTGIWWTDDEGYTWKRVGGGMEIGTQLIGVVPVDHCVLFPTDGGGNGFYRWSRNGKDSIIEIEHCYNYAGVDGLVVYAGRTVQAKNGFYLTTIAPENYNNPNWSNLGGVVATYNGFDFQKIYEDSFGEGTYETAEIGCCCSISDCGDKIILSAYHGGYIELDY